MTDVYIYICIYIYISNLITYIIIYYIYFTNAVDLLLTFDLPKNVLTICSPLSIYISMNQLKKKHVCVRTKALEIASFSHAGSKTNIRSIRRHMEADLPPLPPPGGSPPRDEKPGCRNVYIIYQCVGI